MNDQPFPPQDNNPRHIAIMEGWARRIVMEIAQEMADRVVEKVGEIFLVSKNTNYELHERMRRIEEAIAKGAKAKVTRP